MAIAESLVRSTIDDDRPLARRVNDEIRRRSSSGAAPFFCECREGCLRVVWLDVAAYDREIRDPDTVLLSAGHEQPQREVQDPLTHHSIRV